MDLGHGDSPLFRAVYDGHPDLAELLLQKGACLHKAGKGHKVSLLSAAAAQDSSEMVRALLEHGASLAQSGAIQTAAEGGYIDVLNILMSYGADVDERMKIENVERLSVDDVYQCPNDLLASQAPLHFAASKGQVVAIHCLLEHGADFDNKNIDGKTSPEMLLSHGLAWPKDVTRKSV